MPIQRIVRFIGSSCSERRRKISIESNWTLIMIYHSSPRSASLMVLFVNICEHSFWRFSLWPTGRCNARLPRSRCTFSQRGDFFLTPTVLAGHVAEALRESRLHTGNVTLNVILNVHLNAVFKSVLERQLSFYKIASQCATQSGQTPRAFEPQGPVCWPLNTLRAPLESKV